MHALDLDQKITSLTELYHEFEVEVSPCKKNAVCGLGCVFCCTQMGNIDITTLEGLIIQKRIDEFASPVREEIKQKVVRNRKEKEKGTKPVCPFLQENGSCLIYDVRPFSCRQLYSLRECSSGGPMVHRQAVAMAQDTVRKIQRLDDTGYSGHHSFILHLLDQNGFKNLYLSGGFAPAKIKTFGKKYGIFINRHVQ